MFIIVAGCCKNPETKIVRVPYDTCLIDTFFITNCPNVDSILVVIDSVYNERQDHLDSLKQAALDEVTEYREASIYQVDTMRENYIAWMEDTLAGINTYFDSLKGTVIHDNMFIYGDSVQQSTVMFDSLGIPFIKFE